MMDPERIVESHLNCVRWTIARYIRVNEEVCGLEYDDLYREGCVALCRAAASFREDQGVQFHTYAIPVIRNHLMDYCRRVQSRTVPTVPLEKLDLPPEGRPDCDSGVFVRQVLDYGKRAYSGVAKLGIEAIELKIAGYTGADIARLYGVKPNQVGAWISRAAKKLRRDMFPDEINEGTYEKAS